MKKISVILLALVMIGCDILSPDNKDIFESCRIGAWEFVSQDSAVWVGENVMQKSFKGSQEDTIIISSPQGQEMSMWKGELVDNFNMSYVDSSITFDIAVNDSINIGDTEFTLPKSRNNIVPFDFNKLSFGFSDGAFIINSNMSFGCDVESLKNDNIRVRLFSNGNPYRTYIIRASGFEESVRSFWCD